MLVTTKGQYAMRLMADVARYGEEQPVSLRSVSEREGLSLKYLEQLARPLVKANLLKSVRGKGGGYKLAVAADEIRAGDILRAAEGEGLSVSACEGMNSTCARLADCASVKFWMGLDEVIENYVDGVRLSDIVGSDDVYFDYEKIRAIVAEAMAQQGA